jgi:D-tyrosyl-tRNA(Tyr) deacylase
MKAVVQRVARAAVRVGGEPISRIERGLLVLLGIGKGDTDADADWMIHKLLHLRIFPDEADKMNRSVTDIRGEILVVSQFTLYGDIRRGFRPSFTNALAPADAEKFYNEFMVKLRQATSLKVAEGRFAAMMDVESVNDGPVTVILESVGRASSLSQTDSVDHVGRASSLSQTDSVDHVGRASSLSQTDSVDHVGRASSLSDPQSTPSETSKIPVLQPFDPSVSVGNSRRHMPHWQQPGCTYFVTFRLADSVPGEMLRQWARSTNRDVVREEIQRWLDKGTGKCWLRRPEIGQIVADALRYFDGERYRLSEFVVMPNHVHVLVTPLGEHQLTDILHSWKSYTATRINRVLQHEGAVWQHESFDHIVRSEDSLQRFRQYIRQNPLTAHLKDGEYVCGTG